MDYVFVLDVSGSMEQDGKLGISTASVGAFVKELGTDDRFDIITFHTGLATLFNRLTPAGAQAQAKAADFLAGQSARGGTILRDALAAAYKYAQSDRPLNVVILSDGMTEQGEQETLTEMIRSRPASATVFCIGVGNDVNRPLLEQLAGDAGGLTSFISRDDNMQRQARAFRRKLMHPVASNLRITFDGGSVYDVEPAKLPNLYHGLPVRLYARYRGDGTVKVTLTANVAGKQTTQTGEIHLPGQESGNPEIDRMWALQKVTRLLRQAGGQSGGPTVEEIIRLGEAYSIVTPHTSFIVLENDEEYQRWQIARRNALRLQRDRAAQEKVQAQLAVIKGKAASGIGPQPAESGSGDPSRSSGPPQNGGLRIQFPGSGGGPVGPLAIAAAAGLAVLEWRRRKGPRKP